MGKKSGHGMIQDSILFGVDKYTRKGGDLCDRIDTFLGQEVGQSRKQSAKREYAAATLQKLSGRDVPLPPVAHYGQSLKTLLDYGMIERKKRSGFKVTKAGRDKMKERDKTISTIFSGTKKPKRRVKKKVTGGL